MTSATKSKSNTDAFDDYQSFLLNDEKQPAEKVHNAKSALINHDYDEVYFEPASEEEELLLQLKQLPIPIIPEENLKYFVVVVVIVVAVVVVVAVVFVVVVVAAAVVVVAVVVVVIINVVNCFCCRHCHFCISTDIL